MPLNTVAPLQHKGPFPWHKIVDPDAKAIWEHIGGFQGSMCASLERKHLDQVFAEPYWVCEKTHGTRFLLLVLRWNGLKLVVLVGRNPADMYVCPIRRVPRTWYDGTLIDGEVIQNTKTGAWTFIAFDVITIEGKDMRNSTFSERYNELCTAMFHYEPTPGEDKIALKVKKFYSMWNFKDCVDHARDHVHDYGFPSDGFVMTPERDPVVSGRHLRMFKFKDASDITVDFMIGSQDTALFINDGKNKPMIHVGYLETSGPPPGTIVECKLVSFDGGFWTIVRTRADKTYPNDRMTFERTLVNIKENMTLGEIISRAQCK
jgi:hypothetical protein